MPTLSLTVNGRPWRGEVAAETMLLDVVRDHLQLTGAKLGCGEGQCGSCTLLVDGRAAKACVTPAANGQSVVTVEGLSSDGHLHPVQQAFVDAQAFQCGFCTPGMVIGVVALLAQQARPSDDEIRQALDGHLCRCGTYSRIVQAVRAASVTMAQVNRRG